MNEISVFRVEGIGNTVSISDLCAVISDAMERSTEGGLVWLTYESVLIMLNHISEDYDKQIEIDEENVSGVDMI